MCLALCFSFSTETNAQEKIYPVIKSGGGIFIVPEAVPLVDVKMKYKILVEIATLAAKPDSVHASLDKLARLINLHIAADIPKKNLEVVAVFHNAASPIILSDEAYQKKFNVPNPNTALINELAANGVQFFICGQSLRIRKLTDEKRNPNFKVAQSALLTISTFQLKRFVLVPLQ